MASASPTQSSPDVSQSVQAPTHKRTYQACIPCRRRKVRCDLGSVDNPSDPPCVRCRREKKDCFFTETRRKRKAEEDGDEKLSEKFVARNRRKRDGDKQVEEEREVDDAFETPAQSASTGMMTAGRKAGGLSPNDGRMEKTPESREVTNETAAALFQSPINNPGDALHLLVDAVARTGDLDRQSRGRDSNSPVLDKRQPGYKQEVSHGISKLSIGFSAIDPAITTHPNAVINTEEVGMKDAMQAWSRMRFVRAGWFTAKEAVSYIEYFYKHLAPLTPITPPNFSSPSTHSALLSEEPMLTVTLLTIAARHKNLTGPGGKSRSVFIHEKLWGYLQGMITRMFWGQEQFGGGFCGAGAARRDKKSEAGPRGLRSLGAVESLLLLSEWHPRSMHFPPGDDGDELVFPLLADSEESEPSVYASSGNPHTGWTEPALRSDRMCWSLVGFAYTLSYELGIFDVCFDRDIWHPSWQLSSSHESTRADRIGRLLHIYITQTCGRLGYPNILPRGGKMMNIEFFRMDVQSFNTFGSQELISENVQRAWAELTALMRQSNAEMFESKKMTISIIQTGQYRTYLDAYGPRLREWLERFGSIEAQLPALSRTLLMVEYEYTRTYINSLSLQAVLEHCASTTDENGVSNASQAAISNGQTPPALLSSKLVDIYKENAVYIKEVVDASRNLLRQVVSGLVPNDGLKHAPVRTHFRILSGAMFLLKTFALGAKEKEVAISIQLLDDTVKALRTNVVDDVHLSLRIGDLLDGLTSSIRNKFVRLAIHGSSSKKLHSEADHNPHQTPHHSSKLSSSSTRGIRKSSTSNHAPNVSSYSPTVQGLLANISTNLVDPNDSTITIMPPPDYIYSSYPSAFDSSPHLYAHPLSPQQQAYAHTYHSLQQQHNSQTRPLLSPQHSQHSPNQQQHQHQPQQSTPSYAFPSTHNDTADSTYDWLTLDVNPLLNPGQALGSGGSGQGLGGGGWQGAFGPEISESLEMLGMLANTSASGGGGGDGFSWQGPGDVWG